MATNSIAELADLKVTVDDVLYMPSLEAPMERPHPFVYFISIENQSDRTVTLKARKWVVDEAGGETIVVEGQGIVGKMPKLDPGESFSYNSYHTVAENSQAHGAFFGEDEAGRWYFTRIPEFSLEIPDWA